METQHIKIYHLSIWNTKTFMVGNCLSFLATLFLPLIAIEGSSANWKTIKSCMGFCIPKICLAIPLGINLLFLMSAIIFNFNSKVIVHTLFDDENLEKIYATLLPKEIQPCFFSKKQTFYFYIIERNCSIVILLNFYFIYFFILCTMSKVNVIWIP